MAGYYREGREMCRLHSLLPDLFVRTYFLVIVKYTVSPERTSTHNVTIGQYVATLCIHLQPVYRDPVHDFGILKFDPAKIRYMQVTELKLQPSRYRNHERDLGIRAEHRTVICQFC
jgi:hypothetical protein